MADNARQNQKLKCPRPASAPAPSKNGVAGKGSPTCSAKTKAGSTTYPCRSKNSSVPCIPPSCSPVIFRPGRRFLYEGLLLREFSSMPPSPAHDKFANSLPASRSFVSTLQRLGQGRCIARISDCHGSNGFPTLRDVVRLLGRLRIESRHLVYNQSSRRGFDGKLQACRADDVLFVSVWRGILRTSAV